MNLATRGSLKCQRDVSPKSFYPKGFPMLKSFKAKLALGVVAVAALSSNVMAGGLTVPTSIDTADFMAVAGIVVVASAAMWGVKKAIGLIH